MIYSPGFLATVSNKRTLTLGLACVVFSSNFLLTIASSKDRFPTIDEARYVAAGLGHWHSGTFQAANDAPPLSRMIAVLPVIVWNARGGAGKAALNPVSTGGPPSGGAGVDDHLPLEAFQIARPAGILWWAAGAWLIFTWTSELYGKRAAWFAMVLWAFGANTLAREQVATPDLPAAVACLAALYAFRGWLRSPSWKRAIVSGTLLGVAQLTDFSSLALYIMLPVLFAVGKWVRRQSAPPSPMASQLGQIAMAFAISVLIINQWYLFSGTGRPLNSFRFVSHALTARGPAAGAEEEVAGNRFKGSWLGLVRVPVPADYLAGIDRRLSDFETSPATSKAGLEPMTHRGDFSLGTLLARTPIAFWILCAGSFVLAVLQFRGRAQLAEELVLWLPVLLFLVLACSPLGFLFSMPAMLILPIPLAIIGISKLSLALDRKHWKAGLPVATLFLWAAASGLTAYPYSLYYLNEAVGGPHDVDSQRRFLIPGDGGQDLLALKPWRGEHFGPSLGMGLRHVLGFKAYGPAGPMPPVVFERDITDLREYTPLGGPYPGRYAFDLYNTRLHKWSYITSTRPIGRAGLSILIYEVTPEDDNRVRRESGLASNADLSALKGWLGKHPEAGRIGLACRTAKSPSDHGFEFTVPPINPGPAIAHSRWYTTRTGPYPGYYALDYYNLSLPDYDYFRKLDSIARVGTNILIYHVTLEAANRVRRELGLPHLQANASSGDGRHGFLTRAYEGDDGATFNYAVFVPFDYAADRPFPLILFLHGSGERGAQGRKYLDTTFPAALRKRQDTFGFIAVCPQGHSDDWHIGGEDVTAAMRILETVRKEYNVDPKRIYLSGVSSGGVGVWNLAAAYPDLWAAIVPVATGPCDPGQAPRIAKLPCWCFHNAMDEVCPPSIPRRMVVALRDAGGTPRYTEFVPLASDDVNARVPRHNAWDKAYSMPELYEWLIRQKRP
jgi:predicted esterase